MLKLYPWIDKDGNFFEEITEGAEIMRKKNTIVSSEGYKPIDEIEVYELREIAASIDEDRSAAASVYVSKEFLAEEEDREEALSEYLSNYAPWIFTYGRRETKKTATLTYDGPPEGLN